MNEEEVNKLEALSPTEQKVYSKIYSKRVINTEDVKEILGEDHRSADYITNLRQKGYLDKIRREVYAGYRQTWWAVTLIRTSSW